MLKDVLKNIVTEKKQARTPNFVIKNFLKEFLQYPVLDLIYNNAKYKNFIFTGGSCLRICFGAPRLSEDLDFDLPASVFTKLKLEPLADFLKQDFSDRFRLDLTAKIQGNTRLYLKFPILKELGLAETSESDYLYVKIEPQKSIFSKPEIELTPISQYGFNFVVKNYSLKFLFTSKIIAFLNRLWFKGANNEIDIKGRDFYDLFWFEQNGAKPDWKNLKRVANIGDETKLKLILREKIKKQVTRQKLAYDLKNFFPDQEFVNEFCKNYWKIMGKYL